MNQYISENAPHAEVMRMHGDQVPEFMRPWLERLVKEADDGLALGEIIDKNSELYPDDLREFRRQFIDLVSRAERYRSLFDLLERTVSNMAEILAELPEE